MDKEITSFLITRILQLEAKHQATKGAIGLLADKAGIPHEEIWEMIEDAARKSFQKHRSSISQLILPFAHFLSRRKENPPHHCSRYPDFLWFGHSPTFAPFWLPRKRLFTRPAQSDVSRPLFAC